jgi:DNA-binding beta-propeller fold protein YncE
MAKRAQRRTGPTVRARRRHGRLLTAALLALLAAAFVPAGAKAAPPQLAQFCPTGSAGGQCNVPGGIAVDPTSGDVYVADQVNYRINRFSPWGQFLRTWGWDVVASGPGDDTAAPEDEFEVCVPADGDVCKAGLAGSGSGQFGGSMGGGFLPLSPEGIALDASGDVYVVDLTNLRVQKFTPEGEFVLMFGGDVNKTKVEAAAPEAQRNLCPVDPGDVCQEGTLGTGDGQFGFLKHGSAIAPSPDGETIYAGDVGRIQEFDTGGHYLGEISVPGEAVQSLAVDPTGNLYLTHSASAGIASTTKEDVFKISSTGLALCTLEVPNPQALATDASGNLYVVDPKATGGGPPSRIMQFNSACAKGDEFALEEFDPTDFPGASTGIAASSPPTCGLEGVDLFVANSFQGNSFVRIYGPPPDPDICPPPLLAPTIAETYAVSVGSDGATVRAEIDPHFWDDATYRVQYGTAECIEAGGWEAPCVSEQPPAPGIALSEVPVGEPIPTKGIFLGAAEPLLPNTAYRFRFVSQSSGGGPTIGPERDLRTFPLPAEAKADCPNQAFRTGASANLPDCRAYEMVSPLEKNSSDIALIGGEVIDQASADGEAIAFAAIAAAFADPQGAPGIHQYISAREPSGWSTRSIAAPRRSVSLIFGGGFISPFRFLSEDLCSGWELQDTDTPLVEAAPPGVPNLYRHRGLLEGCGEEDGYELLTPVSPTGFDPEAEPAESRYRPRIQGFSGDGELTVIRAAAPLTPDASDKLTTEVPPTGIYQLYAHEGGQLHLLSVLPNGKAAGDNSSVGTIETPNEATYYRDTNAFQAVSSDGSRVFWSDSGDRNGIEGGAGIGPGELYLRLNPIEPQSAISAGKCTEPAKACTLAVSKAAEALSGTKGSRYLSAAADGSHAIFQVGEDLYGYDVAKALAGEAATTLIASGVQGAMGASLDASRVYLVSSEDLDEGATAGQPNLYLYERGQGHTFIATIPGIGVGTGPEGAKSAISAFPSRRLSRISPDGLSAAFVSASRDLAESVAGYDNRDIATGELTRQVYLYDALGEELVCASCNPSGARPEGRAVDIARAAAQIPAWMTTTHPGRALSADGSRLLFESFEALVPRDTNGKQDVYQWQRSQSEQDCLAGIGGELHVPDSGGCLSLISSGTDSEDVKFVDASEDGEDVFFLTSSSLLSQDIDFRDLYDARAGGGFPPPPTPEPECEGDACQSPASPPPAPTPASSTYRGAGNVSEQPSSRPRCPKGKRRVVRRGKARCIDKPRKQAKRKANRNRRAGR